MSQIKASTTRQELNEAVAKYPFDLSAPTDDRPFFFNQLRITNLASFWLALDSQSGVGRGNLVATVTLTVVVTLSTILVLITTIIPSLPSIRRVTSRIAAAIDSRPIPWFWAVNGAAGVLAAGTAVFVSIHAMLARRFGAEPPGPIAINLARLRRNEPEAVAVLAASG